MSDKNDTCKSWELKKLFNKYGFEYRPEFKGFAYIDRKDGNLKAFLTMSRMKRIGYDKAKKFLETTFPVDELACA